MRASLGRIRHALAPLLALARLTPYLVRARNRPELREVQRSYLRWMPLCLFSEPIRWVWMLLRSPCRHSRPDQRPHDFYVPHLTAVPFPEPDSVARSLEQGFEMIAKEFEQVAERNVPSPSQALVDQGSWNTFPLMRAANPVEENIALCPQTWAVAERCPLLHRMRGGVYFSIMDPGTHVRPHCGPSNLKLRYHLAIEDDEGAMIRSNGEWRCWRRGECLILDDSFEHEVRHDGSRRRAVLIVDCWHPDLTEAEREFLTELHRIWRRRR
jgi:hypothetical protein